VLPKFGVIADDLTGAMDAGVQLLGKDIKVRVVINHKNIHKIDQGADVIIVTTESRNLDSRLAYNKVRQSIDFLNQEGIELIYKKIDSTLRGNIGKELDAVIDSSNKELIIMAPALPFNGRTTIRGEHYVSGVKLEKTELARDPFSPITQSYIPDIISLQSEQKVSIVNIETIRKGKKVLMDEIVKAYEQDCTTIVMDALENQDLRMIACASMDLGKRILLCGSAGLFQFVPQLLKTEEINRDSKEQETPYKVMAENSKHKPVIVLSGSPALMSKRQIEFAVKHLDNIGYLKLHNESLFDSESSRQKELRRVQGEIERILAKGKNLIIDGAGEDKESLRRYYKDNLILLYRNSDILLNILSDILKAIVNKVDIRGLILFGGDTAFRICYNLGVYGVHIVEEVEPYIPAGILIGGRLDGLPVITKAGGFGSESTLVSAIKYFSLINAFHTL
jgi:uncharacterized protein YgbK (DUF1537 family)